MERGSEYDVSVKGKPCFLEEDTSVATEGFAVWGLRCFSATMMSISSCEYWERSVSTNGVLVPGMLCFSGIEISAAKLEGLSPSRGVLLGILALVYFSVLVAADEQGEALYALRSALNASENQLHDWNPYQISPCTWSKVACDDTNNVTSVILPNMGFNGVLSPGIGILKKLTALDLQGNSIHGQIPDTFGNMTSLTMLNLEDNQLSGEIPSSLGNLEKLSFLILSHNHLSGEIPDSLSNLLNLTEVQLASNRLTGNIPDKLFKVPKHNFTGNHLNCGIRSPHLCASQKIEHRKSWAGIATGTVVASFFLILLLGCILHLFLRLPHSRRCKLDVFVDVAGEAQRFGFGQLKRFSWIELQLATDNFCEENVLGQGGFGKVYKGVLADDTMIAVKRLTDFKSPASDAAFQREVEMISVAVHRNLLRLIGFCTTPTERLLVYPFMHNLSVASRLRDLKPGQPALDWSTRKKAALGTARGLEYLHEHCNPKIIHRDVKAANVLLNDKFEAVVGDFGLAKLVDVRKTNVTTVVRGTLGHIAPEYLSTGKSSEKTDVFGYGIMLLELVTGQRAIDFSRMEEEEDDVLLLDLVKRLQSERKLKNIVDMNLGSNFEMQEVEMMVQVSLLCTQSSPEDRPAMSEVVQMLEGEGLAQKWEAWEQKEITRKLEFERLQRRMAWPEDSICNQDGIQLSGGR